MSAKLHSFSGINNFSPSGKEQMTVEDIQDRVELELMKSPRKEVAKRYIAYRNQRSEIEIKRGNGLAAVHFVLGSFERYAAYYAGRLARAAA